MHSEPALPPFRKVSRWIWPGVFFFTPPTYTVRLLMVHPWRMAGTRSMAPQQSRGSPKDGAALGEVKDGAARAEVKDVWWCVDTNGIDYTHLMLKVFLRSTMWVDDDDCWCQQGDHDCWCVKCGPPQCDVCMCTCTLWMAHWSRPLRAAMPVNVCFTENESGKLKRPMHV